MAVLSHTEIRDIKAWLDSLKDYYASIGRLVGASQIAVERLEMLLDQNDLPLGLDSFFPLSASVYEDSD